MRYKLWDTDTDKLFAVSDLRTETASLARTLLATYDTGDADDLELIVETEGGELIGNYFGAALAAWADDVLAGTEMAICQTDQHRYPM